MWIARDKDGMLGFYFNKPVKGINEWSPMFEDENYVAVDSNMFPEVKWEDEEPRELVLKNDVEKQDNLDIPEEYQNI